MIFIALSALRELRISPLLEGPGSSFAARQCRSKHAFKPQSRNLVMINWNFHKRWLAPSWTVKLFLEPSTLSHLNYSTHPRCFLNLNFKQYHRAGIYLRYPISPHPSSSSCQYLPSLQVRSSSYYELPASHTPYISVGISWNLFQFLFTKGYNFHGHSLLLKCRATTSHDPKSAPNLFTWV